MLFGELMFLFILLGNSGICKSIVFKATIKIKVQKSPNSCNKNPHLGMSFALQRQIEFYGHNIFHDTFF